MPGPMGRRGPAAERAKDFKGTIKRLIIYIAHERIALVIAIACAIGSVVFNVMGPRILGQATTELFQGLARSTSRASGRSCSRCSACTCSRRSSTSSRAGS